MLQCSIVSTAPSRTHLASGESQGHPLVHLGSRGPRHGGLDPSRAETGLLGRGALGAACCLLQGQENPM